MASQFSSFLFHSWLLGTLISLAMAADRSTYIVHMEGSVMPKAFTDYKQWYSASLKSLATDPISVNQAAAFSESTPSNLFYVYKNVMHGFTAALSDNELQALKKMPGVLGVHKDRQVTMDTTHTYEFLDLNSATGLWPASNYGEDVIIGVIDTGVWPEHQSFNDRGMGEIPKRWKGTCEVGQDFNTSMCNRKLIGARYFNKGVMAANPGVNISMNSARDWYGHGTHMSSIAAGSYASADFFGYAPGIARGIAHRARLAIYKVSWEEGSYASDFLAGMDQAVADGVDVISISWGFDDGPFYEDPLAIASFAAMEKGIFVSTSAGNDGPELSTVHNGMPWVLTVAAGTIDRQLAGTLTLGNGQTIIGTTQYPVNALSLDMPLVYNETILSCNSPSLLSSIAAGQIVICKDNGSVWAQELDVIKSTVAGAIFITNLTDFSYSSALIAITPEDGITLQNYAKNNPSATVTIKFKKITVLGTPTAPRVSSYSSRGPSLSFPGILKPDIMAPGVDVLAAWPSNSPVAFIGTTTPLPGDFKIFSGTSLACAHASGVAALLKSAHPGWSPAAIHSAMMTTANALDNALEPIKDIGNYYNPASPLAMGAGQVDPNRALDPGLIYDATPQDYISLLCGSNYSLNQIMMITRSSKAYDCSKPSTDLNHPSFIANFNTSSTNYSQTFERTVTNVGDGAATYKVHWMTPTWLSIVVEPKVLVFKDKYEKISYKVYMKASLQGEKSRSYGFGHITWVDETEKYNVRSPFVVLI
ncbi:hypothetical protein J5N97_020736 [Dioscorea zingiberensis]|uniref:Subtilisin-like protease SBT1.9 n=1 Tax=Dioscorea zingiberensis TaxID=325984 RepID=A0A9D5CHN9_9LILI|nr:hypothetical protein J5N97_020736 [Dioscorea zingiberensis]